MSPQRRPRDVFIGSASETEQPAGSASETEALRSDWLGKTGLCKSLVFLGSHLYIMKKNVNSVNLSPLIFMSSPFRKEAQFSENLFQKTKLHTL